MPMPEMSNPLPLEAIKIDDMTYRIEDNGVRMFLFIGAEKALLVDTGFGAAGSLKAVVESLTDLPVRLINTHCDPDHIGNNHEFGSARMHPAEMANYARYAKPGAKVKPVWDGDIIELGKRRLGVILIPGHTPGSIALLDWDNRVIVAGDSLTEGPVFMFGDTRSLDAYIASMEKLKTMLKKYDTIYTSHGPFPVPSDTIIKSLTAARLFQAGELAPEEPGIDIPAKMYMHEGVGFFI